MKEGRTDYNDLQDITVRTLKYLGEHNWYFIIEYGKVKEVGIND